MNGFDPIPVTYRGETNTIAADQCLVTMAEVEEHLTILETVELVSQMSDPQKIKTGKLTAAYHALLRKAGFTVSQREALIYVSTPEGLESAVKALDTLFSQMQNPEEGAAEAKKPKTTKRRKTKS